MNARLLPLALLLTCATSYAGGPLSPEDSLKAFKVAPGFHVELVASEPLVDHPVAVDYDADGRLWVVEMPGYMKDVKGTGLGAPTGRVVVLTDTDGDGKMDTRTVFLDGLVLPRSIKCVGKGALVGEPPHLWYCPDENGDLKADGKIAVASDYFLREGNPELGPNGPIWALDNWIYQSAYTSRLRFEKGTFRREGDLERGQWGLTQDDVGRLFYNINHDQLRGDLVPAQYYLRNPSAAGRSGVDMPIATDQTIFPVRATPDVNDGGKPGLLRADGSLKSFTSACGPCVYRGDAYPADALGNAFVCEPACNLIKRNILKESGLLVQAQPAYADREWLASTDGWFRPVNVVNAPDGTLTVVDMYKGIILYKQFMTDHMKKQVAQVVDPASPLGRIWRVAPDAPHKSTRPELSKATTAQLVEALSNPSGWWRDTAQRLLVERGDATAIPLLKALALGKGARLGRLHALWALEGTGGLDEATLLEMMKEMDRKLRATAVRLSEPFLRQKPGGALEKAVLALGGDKQREVRVQVAFSLGESTSVNARAAAISMLNAGAGDIFISDAVLSGLRGREIDTLAALRNDASWAQTYPGRVRVVRLIASSIVRARQPEPLAQLLALIARGTSRNVESGPSTDWATAANPTPKAPLGWLEAALLEGLFNSVKGGSLPPIRLAAAPAAFQALLENPEQSTADRAKSVLDNLTWPGKTGFVPAPPPRALTPEETARLERGRQLYASDCAACHQSDGLGQRGRAPPLVSTPWVSGRAETISRIVLHGVKGPLKVHDDEWKMEMPSLGHLDDEQAAAILTYVRRAWGNGADPVAPATVAEVRKATAAHSAPFSSAELEAAK